MTGARIVLVINFFITATPDDAGRAPTWLIPIRLGQQASGLRVEVPSAGAPVTTTFGDIDLNEGELRFVMLTPLTVTGTNYGIDLQAGAGGVVPYGGNFNVTVTGNTITDPGTNPFVDLVSQGLLLNNGIIADDSFSTCVAIGTNSLTNSGRNAGGDFRVRQRQSTTVRLPGYPGAPYDTGAVVTFLNAQIGGSPVGGTATASMAGPGFLGTGTTCP